MIFELHVLSEVVREDTSVTNNNNIFTSLGV